MRYLIGALCAAAILFGAAPDLAVAATVGCGRVTTFVAPDSSGALNSGDGWMIFAKPDGSSDKVIIKSGRLTPTGSIGGYVCIAIDGLYFDGVLAPGTAGYIPEPAVWFPSGTAVYCGVVAPNSVTSGQGSGPRTFELRVTSGPGGGGRFSVPESIALPAIGSYLCGVFAQGAPMNALLSALRPGDPAYVGAGGLPSTSTDPGTSAPATPLAGLLLVVGLAWLTLRVRASGSRSVRA